MRGTRLAILVIGARLSNRIDLTSNEPSQLHTVCKGDDPAEESIPPTAHEHLPRQYLELCLVCTSTCLPVRQALVGPTWPEIARQQPETPSEEAMQANVYGLVVSTRQTGLFLGQSKKKCFEESGDGSYICDLLCANAAPWMLCSVPELHAPIHSTGPDPDMPREFQG